MKTVTTALMLIFAILGTACSSGSSIDQVDNPVVHRQTIDGVGACQGVFVWDGSIWMYGDKSGNGVVKRLEWVGPESNGGPKLVDTGEIYALTLYRNFQTRAGDPLKPDPIPHPTGLTYHPDYDTFIGNTVNQVGHIHHMHFLGFTESGGLDDWIHNKALDDLATNGTRPEFIRYNGRWVIATADYGDEGNQLRLYDPDKLKTAKKTSEPGVLVAAFDCGPFVQSMHWIDAENTLVLAQNQTAGLGYRLTLMKFGEGAEPPTVERVIDLGYPEDELEGFAVVAPGWAVMTSAMREGNVSIIRWPIKGE